VKKHLASGGVLDDILGPTRSTFREEASDLITYLGTLDPAEGAEAAIAFNRRAQALGIAFHLHYDGSWLGDWLGDAFDFPPEDVGISMAEGR
jgi:hypothetical protein